MRKCFCDCCGNEINVSKDPFYKLSIKKINTYVDPQKTTEEIELCTNCYKKFASLFSIESKKEFYF